jgi:hypothetical protein
MTPFTQPLKESLRKRNSHLWDRDPSSFYCEPVWCSKRLFDVEDFAATIYDPACGTGRILASARDAGYSPLGSDVVKRAEIDNFVQRDFLTWCGPIDRNTSVVCNPPFDHVQEFIEQALYLGGRKVAMVILVRRLNAAGKWLKELPLARVYLLTPRPSMPPGYVIAAGEKPGGGTQDFCWLVMDRTHRGPPELRWLHREDARL